MYRVVETSPDLAAARRFFEHVISQHDLPESITIDKSGANTAAINSVIADTGGDILMRKCKFLNNIVEQAHRAIKRVTRAMTGFKNFHCALSLIAGIETMHMIKKSQMKSGPLKFDTISPNFQNFRTARSIKSTT